MGKRKILNIFVSVDTPVCAKSVVEFERFGGEFDDVALLMVSYDLPFAHKRFHEEFELTHVVGLSAIRHAGFGENYGVQIVDGPLAGMFSRAGPGPTGTHSFITLCSFSISIQAVIALLARLIF